jgi:hypothetical protein
MIKKVFMSQPILSSQQPLLTEIRQRSGETYLSFNLLKLYDQEDVDVSTKPKFPAVFAQWT